VVGGKLAKEVGKQLRKRHEGFFRKHKKMKNKDGNCFKCLIKVEKIMKMKQRIYKIKGSVEKRVLKS
jgi:hypothetical protein